MKVVHSPVLIGRDVQGNLSRHTAEHSFLMKLVICHLTYKPHCCAPSKHAPLCALVVIKSSLLTIFPWICSKRLRFRNPATRIERRQVKIGCRIYLSPSSPEH